MTSDVANVLYALYSAIHDLQDACYIEGQQDSLPWQRPLGAYPIASPHYHELVHRLINDYSRRLSRN